MAAGASAGPRAWPGRSFVDVSGRWIAASSWLGALGTSGHPGFVGLLYSLLFSRWLPQTELLTLGVFKEVQIILLM